MEKGCPVCGSEDCRPHSHIGSLPRVLGGTRDNPSTVLRRKRRGRAKRGPVEDRAVHGPTEDR